MKRLLLFILDILIVTPCKLVKYIFNIINNAYNNVYNFFDKYSNYGRLYTSDNDVLEGLRALAFAVVTCIVTFTFSSAIQYQNTSHIKLADICYAIEAILLVANLALIIASVMYLVAFFFTYINFISGFYQRLVELINEEFNKK
jgi:phosphatidylserine synthase